MKRGFGLILALVILFCIGTAVAGSVTLPADLQTIEANSFDGCESLSGVLYVPVGITIDSTAFQNTPNLTVIHGVAVIGDDIEAGEGTLDRDVKTAVSSYCESAGIEECYYTTDPVDALDKGYNVIIKVGFIMDESFSELTSSHPEAYFICLDNAVDDQGDNVYCVQYQTDQSGFMAGYAAVMMGYRSLGFLGGIDMPDVVNFGQGFIQGANQAASELGITDRVRVVRNYTGTFAPDESVYKTAEDWYDKGVEVIFCCGGSQCESVIQAANKKGKKMIGVDTDQSSLGDAVVTSAMKNLGYSATAALSCLLNGNWNEIGGETECLGVINDVPEDNHVCLAPSTVFSENFTRAKYEEMVAKLHSGIYPAGDIAIAVMDEPVDIRGVAVVGDDNNPERGTLDWDVKTAVSAYCESAGIDNCYYTTDPVDALDKGYNVIITVGFMASDTVSELQASYPDAYFICLDSTVDDKGDNVYCVLYQTDQSGFMAGYAAVMMGYRSLGFLGGVSEVTDVVKFGDGFVQGANQAAAELGITDRVRVARNYTGTFEPGNNVYNKAKDWYDKGVEVIFCCGGNQCKSVIQAAKETGKKMIGVDTDQNNLGSAVVTSAMKNLGYSATAALTSLLNGKWDEIGGETELLGVISDVPENNHVCLAPLTVFSGRFTEAKYKQMVASLHGGDYPSGDIAISVTEEPVEITEEEVTLNYYEVNPYVGTISGDMANAFKQKVEELSGGLVKVSFSSGSQESYVLTSMFGDTPQADVCRISASTLPAYASGCNKAKLFSLPYAFDSFEHFETFATSELATEFLNEPQTLGFPVRGLAYGHEGFRHFFFREMVSGVGSLAGRTIRVANDEIMNGLVTGLGAAPVHMTFSEMNNALKEGTLDGSEQPATNYIANEYHKSAPYLVRDGHTLGVLELIITDAAWNRLSANQKEWVQAAADYAGAVCRQKSKTAEENALATEGVTVIELQDKEAWVQAAEDIVTANLSGEDDAWQALQDLR